MVKTIQQAAGSLNLIFQALPTGCPCLASLYRLTCTSDGAHKKLGHHRHISVKTHEDMQVIAKFLEHDAPEKIKTVPFLNKLKVFNLEIKPKQVN